jgi:hypothetical protein
MNMSLLIMMGVALLLLAVVAKGSRVWKWSCVACGVLLMIQPLIAVLKWLGEKVGV